MTEKGKGLTAWITIGLTLLLAISNWVYSSAVVTTKVEQHEKKIEKQELDIDNNEQRINFHDQTVKATERLEKSFKEFQNKYEVDQKEQQTVNTQILLQLERLNTKFEERK